MLIRDILLWSGDTISLIAFLLFIQMKIDSWGGGLMIEVSLDCGVVGVQI